MKHVKTAKIYPLSCLFNQIIWNSRAAVSPNYGEGVRRKSEIAADPTRLIENSAAVAVVAAVGVRNCSRGCSPLSLSGVALRNYPLDMRAARGGGQGSRGARSAR